MPGPIHNRGLPNRGRAASPTQANCGLEWGTRHPDPAGGRHYPFAGWKSLRVGSDRMASPAFRAATPIS
jgi:hypothetical protein